MITTIVMVIIIIIVMVDYDYYDYRNNNCYYYKTGEHYRMVDINQVFR